MKYLLILFVFLNSNTWANENLSTNKKYKIPACFKYHSDYYNLPIRALITIMKQEGGKIGQVVKNKNGTYDHGIFQINTIWIDILSKKLNITKNDLIYNACKSAQAATYILNIHFQRTGDIWEAMGNYHSKNLKYKTKYLNGLSQKVNF